MSDIDIKAEHARIAEILTAAENLVEIARNMDTEGPFNAFTCLEAEAFSDLMAAAGDAKLAEQVIWLHSFGDNDPEDQHHDLFLEHRANGRVES